MKADMILMEWSPYLMQRMGGDPAVVLEFLRDNFSLGAINESPEAHREDSVFRPIDEICAILTNSIADWRHTPFRYCDVLAKR